MYRNQNLNYESINGISQRRHNPPYARTSLRQHIKRQWLTTGLGIIGLAAGIFSIVGNEARTVQISKSLEESISLVTPLVPNDIPDKSNFGKLVYLTGNLIVHQPLVEVDYGISVLAVKLVKNVQMYQWEESRIETADEEGNFVNTDYTYNTEWKSQLIDSSMFYDSTGHWNPKEFPIKSDTIINEHVKIGNYHLGKKLKEKFKDMIPVTGDERPERRDIKLHDGVYYHTDNIWKPNIGDIRILFQYSGVHGQIITIVAELNDELTLVPYSLKQGDKLLILRSGNYSLEDMFAYEHLHNRLLTWVFRGISWLLLYVSCICLGTFLEIIITHSHFLQDVLPDSHFSVKMTVSMSLSLFVTALAWMWYRPILGFGLIFATVSVLFFNKWFSGSSRGYYNRL